MISDRLNRRENDVMNAVFELSGGKERFLVSPGVRMRDAGLGYRRRDYQRKRGLVFRIAVAALGAVVTFLVGLLLRAIFG